MELMARTQNIEIIGNLIDSFVHAELYCNDMMAPILSIRLSIQDLLKYCVLHEPLLYAVMLQ